MEYERSQIRVFTAAVLRLFCSPKYWIKLASVLILAFASPYVLDVFIDASKNVSEEILEAFRIGNNYNIGVLTVPSLNYSSEISCDRLVSGVLSGSVIQCVIVMISTRFIADEFSFGYIKYAIISGQRRPVIFLEYIAINIASSVIPALACPLCVLLSLCLKEQAVIQNPELMAGTIISQLIMLLAICILFSVIAFFTDGKGATLLGLCSILVMPLAPNYISIFTKGKISVEGAFIFTRLVNSCEMSADSFSGDIIIALITSVAFVVIGLIVFEVRNYY